MRAVLLAAGVGSRLGAITDRVPKCMVEIGGTPILEHDVRWLVDAGVVDIAINLHHLPEAVTGHFGDGSSFGARIKWSSEAELLGTAGTVASLRDWLTDRPFVVVYGDNWQRVDLEACVAAHRGSGAAATVAVFEREDVRASGVAELAASGHVARFVEKPAPGETESRLVNAGLLVCEPEVLDRVPERGDLSLHVLPGLAESRRLHGHVLGDSEHPLWVDTPADLERTLLATGGRV